VLALPPAPPRRHSMSNRWLPKLQVWSAVKLSLPKTLLGPAEGASAPAARDEARAGWVSRPRVQAPGCPLWAPCSARRSPQPQPFAHAPTNAGCLVQRPGPRRAPRSAGPSGSTRQLAGAVVARGGAPDRQPRALKRHLHKAPHGGGLAGRDNVVIRLVLLQHQPPARRGALPISAARVCADGQDIKMAAREAPRCSRAPVAEERRSVQCRGRLRGGDKASDVGPHLPGRLETHSAARSRAQRAVNTHTRAAAVGAHALHVVARMPPVTLRVDVAQVQAVLLAELDPRGGHRHLRRRRRVRPAHSRTHAPHMR